MSPKIFTLSETQLSLGDMFLGHSVNHKSMNKIFNISFPLMNRVFNIIFPWNVVQSKEQNMFYFILSLFYGKPIFSLHKLPLCLAT